MVDRNGNEITEARWWLVQQAVEAFIVKYPAEWVAFRSSMNENRTEYGTTNEQGLKQANWRNLATFPTIEDGEGNTLDELLPTLQKLLPGLTTREKGKKNKILPEFLNRFPAFKMSEKS